jgi:hypothetical protein
VAEGAGRERWDASATNTVLTPGAHRGCFPESIEIAGPPSVSASAVTLRKPAFLAIPAELKPLYG